MAGVTCTGCGAHVTVRGLTKCPICGIPMEPILDERIKTATRPAPVRESVRVMPPPTVLAAPSPARPHGASLLGAKEWFAIIVLSAIAILVGLIAYRVAVPSESKLRDRAVSAALYQCQRAIQMTAQYGGADLPPYAKNNGGKDEFYFTWPRGSFEFSNGFGAREKMSASCTGDLTTGEIKHLTVNAKDII
jgi:hypothetical protein